MHLRHGPYFSAWYLFFGMVRVSRIPIKSATDILSSIQDYHTLQPPLCETCSQKPLPDSEEDPAWYGSFWLIYPLANAPILVQHGPLFKAKMELAVIMNSISAAFFYRKEETEVNRRTQLRLASRSVETLTAWRSLLPVSLSPERTVFPSQLKLQYVALHARFESSLIRALILIMNLFLRHYSCSYLFPSSFHF